jgi:hypothetical protein
VRPLFRTLKAKRNPSKIGFGHEKPSGGNSITDYFGFWVLCRERTLLLLCQPRSIKRLRLASLEIWHRDQSSLQCLRKGNAMLIVYIAAGSFIALVSILVLVIS